MAKATATLSARDMFRTARTTLVLDQPFWGALSLRLKMVEDPSCDTAWTDGIHLGFNPTWFSSLTPAQRIGLLAHEVMHCAGGHMWRRDGRDPKDWNIAADYAINIELVECGFELPPDGYIDKAYKGKSAEWIYSRVREEKKSQPKPQQGQSGQGQGQQGQQGQARQGGSQAAQAPAPGQKGQKGQSGQPSGQQDDAAKGQPASGQPTSGHGSQPAVDPSLDVRDAPADAAEQGATEADWQQAVQEAAVSAHARGKLPANLQRLVKNVTKPKVDWKATLHRFVQQAARTDYSWRRPNTRFMSMGLYIPSLYSEEVGPIAVTIDTSGSVDGVMLDQFVSELKGIVAEVKPARVYVLYADARVKRMDTFERDDEIVIKPAGGGGTDFRPAIDACEKMDDMPPVCMVYITDLYGTFPTSAPNLPILWATPPTSMEPPFGEHIVIE